MSTRRRRVRSIVVRALVFLLLGAVVNVAVAWWLSWRIPRYSDGVTADDLVEIDVIKRLEVGWFARKFDGFGATQFNSIWRRDWINTIEVDGNLHPLDLLPPGFGLERPSPEFGNDARRFWSRDVYFRGWPLRSCSYSIDAQPSGGDLILDGGFVVGPLSAVTSRGSTVHFRDGRRTLPYRPIWPGFAINTFFYAAILWMLFAGPGRVRRWRRIRRGLCAKCAYPVGASDVCTECGERVQAERGIPA